MIEFHLVGTRNWVAFGQKMEGDGRPLMVRNLFVILCAWPNLAINLPMKFTMHIYRRHITI